MLPFEILSLASGLRGGGSTKSSSTSNVASTNVVNVANLIGSGSTGEQGASSPATATPTVSLADATSPEMPFFGGGSSSTGFDATYDLGNQETSGGFDFKDPVVLGFIALLGVGAYLALR